MATRKKSDPPEGERSVKTVEVQRTEQEWQQLEDCCAYWTPQLVARFSGRLSYEEVQDFCRDAMIVTAGQFRRELGNQVTTLYAVIVNRRVIDLLRWKTRRR